MVAFKVDIHEMINTLFSIVEYESTFDARNHLQSICANSLVIAVSLYVYVTTTEADKGLAALFTRGNIFAIVHYFDVSPTKKGLFELGSACFANAMLFFVMTGAFFFRDKYLVA